METKAKVDSQILVNEDLTSQVDVISPYLKQCVGKGKEVPAGSILQVHQISNISFPLSMSSDGDVSYDCEKDILKIVVTDGHTQAYALVVGNCPPGISLDTPPGTKVKVVQPIPVHQRGLFVLTRSNSEVLGGRVSKLVVKWEAERKHVIKHEWGHHTAGTSVDGLDSPPAWKPFGQKSSVDISSVRKMKAADVISAKKEGQLQGEKSAFDVQREEAISELHQSTSTCLKFKKPNKQLLAMEVKDIMGKGFSKRQAEEAMNQFKDVGKALKFLKDSKIHQGGVPKEQPKIKMEPKDRKEKKRGKGIKDEEEDERQVPVEYQRPTKTISLFGFIENHIKILNETTSKTSHKADKEKGVKITEGGSGDKCSDEQVGGMIEKLNIKDSNRNDSSSESSDQNAQERGGNENNKGNRLDDREAQLGSKDSNTEDKSLFKEERQGSSHLWNQNIIAETGGRDYQKSLISREIDTGPGGRCQDNYKHEGDNFRASHINRGYSSCRQGRPTGYRGGYQQRSMNRDSQHFRLRRNAYASDEIFRRPQQNRVWRNGKFSNHERNRAKIMDDQHYRQPQRIQNESDQEHRHSSGNVQHFHQQQPPSTGNFHPQQCTPSENVQIPFNKYLQGDTYQQNPSSRYAEAKCYQRASSGHAQDRFQQRPISGHAQGQQRPQQQHRPIEYDAPSFFQQLPSSWSDQLRYQQRALNEDDQLRPSLLSNGNDQMFFQQRLSMTSGEYHQNNYRVRWRISREEGRFHHQQRSLHEGARNFYQERLATGSEWFYHHSREAYNRQEQRGGNDYRPVAPSRITNGSTMRNYLSQYERSMYGTTMLRDNDPVCDEPPAMTIGHWGDTESEKEFQLQLSKISAESVASKLTDNGGWSSFRSDSTSSNFFQPPSPSADL